MGDFAKMPFKDPEQRKKYHREYKRRLRAKERETLCQTQTQAPEPQIPRSLNWTKPYERRADYYLQEGWLFDTYTGRPVKRYEGPV